MEPPNGLCSAHKAERDRCSTIRQLMSYYRRPPSQTHRTDTHPPTQAAREASTASLEDALREAVDVAVQATCSSSATSPSSLLPPTPASAGTEAAGLGVALLAAAAEDVAVQAACALMAARLAQGEVRRDGVMHSCFCLFCTP